MSLTTFTSSQTRSATNGGSQTAAGALSAPAPVPTPPRPTPPVSIRVFLVCAIATALLWWLPSQRLGWFALGWVALLPLLWSLDGLPGRARWWRGWGAGWLAYVVINWWIVPTTTAAGPAIGFPAAVGALLGMTAVALIALVHGSIVALVAWLWNPHHRWTARAPFLLPIAVALVWALLDAARYETVLAYGWGALAYTQWRDTALLQSTIFIGQHGLSALCVWFAASLALWLRRGDAILWRAPVVVFLALHLWGAWRLKMADAQPPRRTLRVLLVQTAVPGLPQSDKEAQPPLTQALRLMRDFQAKNKTAPGAFDLIVWPESTASLFQPGSTSSKVRPPRQGSAMIAINEASRKLQTPLLVGASTLVNDRDSLNEALLVAPDGSQQGSTKQHLVPFGERAPFGEYVPFLNRLAPERQVSPGDAATVLHLPLDGSKGTLPGSKGTLPGSKGTLPGSKGTLPIGGVICFESCFRYPARAVSRDGAQALFVLTNDMWFGGTNAPWDHVVVAILRAVENGVPVAQASNGGHSFVVDAYGRFVPLDNGAPMSPFGREQAVPATMPLP